MIEVKKLYPALESVVCFSGISDETTEKIVQIGDKLQFSQAKVGSSDDGGSFVPEIRKSMVSWIPHTEEYMWMWQHLSEITSQINFDKFRFELCRITGFQYTTYTTGGYYDWHIDGQFDRGFFGEGVRKLGLTLMLSDPDEDFEGGDFEIVEHGNIKDFASFRPKKSEILAFPSFVPHRVCEVTSGKRKSLVWWVEGPSFK